MDRAEILTTIEKLDATLKVLAERKARERLAFAITEEEEQRVLGARRAMAEMLPPLKTVTATGTGGLTFKGAGTGLNGQTQTKGGPVDEVKRPTVLDAAQALIRVQPGITRREVVDALEKRSVETNSKDPRKLLGTRIGQMIKRKQIFEYGGGLHLKPKEPPAGKVLRIS